MYEVHRQKAHAQGQAQQPVPEINLPAAVPRVADLNMRLEELNSILCAIGNQIGIAPEDGVEYDFAAPDRPATPGYLNALHSELDCSSELLESARRRAESLVGVLV